MDPKSIGKTIASLRKKQGLTQSELAQKLNVSNKAVSKWENGLCYPDIELFPMIASLFGVSADYLMMKKKGIGVAGTIVIDIVKSIDSYPTIGTLTNITSVSSAVGGCVSNVGIDLARMDPQLSVSGYGKIGNDENGRFILSKLVENGVNIDGIVYSKDRGTSFTDVMSIPAGERTFFHTRGANAEFCPEDIDVKKLNCDIFHIGYILLMDKLDAPDSEYGTVLARLLADVQREGIMTSVDMVSQSDGNYADKVIPALKYCNYFIVNEIEICGIFGLSPRKENGEIDVSCVRRAMKLAAENGVSTKVIVHAKEISFLYDVKSGDFISMPSLKIPKEEILGSVGAGDAFCAGCLYGLYHHYTDKKILEFASAAAACNLFAANSIDGMRSAEEILKMPEKYGRLELTH
ncbi:MAG: helix-turn-helix domain-containing protein [Clostridia bacterium]|nr:helix-turn-helix domain-containing protein [Clostridia bacterium]